MPEALDEISHLMSALHFHAFKFTEWRIKMVKWTKKSKGGILKGNKDNTLCIEKCSMQLAIIRIF